MATVEVPTRPEVRLHDTPFANEALTDFSREENARKMRAAIEKVRGQLGREYDLIIGGKRIKINVGLALAFTIVHTSGDAGGYQGGR